MAPPSTNPELDPSPLILVVDDHDSNREMVVDYLRAKGQRVESVNSGAAALQFVSDRRPRIIVLDIQMPDINGLEVIQQIRAEPLSAETLIIALTALAMPADQERILRAGADRYLSKPVRLSELAQSIQSYLHHAGH